MSVKALERLDMLRAKTEQSSSNSMLTIESQGPRAKLMLYPYYFTMVATSAGKPNSRSSSEARTTATDTIHSHHVRHVPHGSRPQDLVLDYSRRTTIASGWAGGGCRSGR